MTYSLKQWRAHWIWNMLLFERITHLCNTYETLFNKIYLYHNYYVTHLTRLCSIPSVSSTYLTHLYLYKYENVCLCVCLCFRVFLGHFVTDWETLWHKVALCFRKCSKTIKFQKKLFSAELLPFFLFL